MSYQNRTRLALVSACAGVLFAFAPSAFAGECPDGQAGTDLMRPGATAPVGVTDTELGSIDLAKEQVRLDGHRLRLRQLVIEPGGVVPWHSHAERPALIYVVEGTILEYASTCAVPITHKAGELSREFGGLAHWWLNAGEKPVVLLSADIVHDADENAAQM